MYFKMQRNPRVWVNYHLSIALIILIIIQYVYDTEIGRRMCAHIHRQGNIIHV